MHHEGWMTSDQETIFCWVSVPKLTMVVTTVCFFFFPTYLPTYLPTNNPQASCLVGRKNNPYLCINHIVTSSSYLFSYPSTRICDLNTQQNSLPRWDQIWTQLRFIHKSFDEVKTHLPTKNDILCNLTL
jgi:hypothetical protein